MGGSEPTDAIRAVNAILTQLDALKRHPNVMVLTTSNITGGSAVWRVHARSEASVMLVTSGRETGPRQYPTAPGCPQCWKGPGKGKQGSPTSSWQGHA